MGLSTVDAFKHLASSDALEISPAQLRALQLVLAGIVDDIAVVCREQGLTWLLAGGTALGAVRHGGFIPWDDDVDVIFPRADGERFLDAFRECFGDKYWVHAPGRTRGYALAFARIRLKGTHVKTREDLIGPDDEAGAFIDIFFAESTFSNRFLRALHGFGSMGLGFLYSCRKFFRERRLVRRWAAENEGFSLAFRIKLFIGLLTAILPMGVWVWLWDGWNGLYRNPNSTFVAVPVGRKHFFGELAKRADFCRTRNIAWEGRMCPVPVDLDGYMKRLYGSQYMTPPPPEKRERHVFFTPFNLGSAGKEVPS